MLLAIGLKFFRVVAIVAVKNKQPIFTLRTRYYIKIEIPNLIHTFLINNLAIINYCNTPGFREAVLFILVGEIILPS